MPCWRERERSRSQETEDESGSLLRLSLSLRVVAGNCVCTVRGCVAWGGSFTSMMVVGTGPSVDQSTVGLVEDGWLAQSSRKGSRWCLGGVCLCSGSPLARGVT